MILGPPASPPGAALAPSLLATCASPPGAGATLALAPPFISPRAPPPYASDLTPALPVQRAPPPGATASASALTPALHARRAPPLTGARLPVPHALLATRALDLLGGSARAPCLLRLLPVPATTPLLASGMHTTIVTDGGAGEVHQRKVAPQTCEYGVGESNTEVKISDARGEMPGNGLMSSADRVGGANNSLVASNHGGDVRKGAESLLDAEKTEQAGGEVLGNGLTSADGVGGANNSLVAGKDDVHVDKTAGDVFNGCQSRCDCSANFKAFKLYADQNREETLNQVKQILEQHRCVCISSKPRHYYVVFLLV